MKTQLPREKMQTKGAGALRDIELVRILLANGNRNRKLKSLANEVLNTIDYQFDSLDIRQLTQIRGIGLAKACTIMAALEFARRRYRPITKTINSPTDVFHCVLHLADRQENFITLTLNGAEELIKTRLITKGLTNRTLVHPREVFIDAIADCAATIIMAHNHPSGNLQPSKEDLMVTENIAKAGSIIGIKLRDHLIFNKNNFISLSEEGFLQ